MTPVVQAATKPPGGAWGAPQTISGAYGFNPVVAVDAAGNAVAAWFHFDGATNVAQAVTRPAGGTWSAPQTLSVAGEPATIPEVAIDPAGNALAVWQRSDGSNYIIQAATKPAVGAWSTGQDLSAPGQDAFGPHVAVDAAGNAVAIWYRSNGTINVTQAATKPVGGAWSPAQDVSAGRGGIYPRVALDSAGDIYSSNFNSDTITASMHVAACLPCVTLLPWAAGGAWSSVQDLSAVGETDQYPELALDPAGDAALAWQHLGTNSIVRAVGRDAAGPVFAGLSIPARGTVGTRLSFSVSPFDVWSALGPAPIWSFGDGGTAAGTRVRHTYGRAGAHRVTLTQADAVGNQSTTTRTITIAAACVVPKVSGKTLARAKAAIARAHCRTGKVTHAYSKKVRKGRVVSQSPKAGKRLTHGARVKLVVSRGKRR